MEVINTHYRNFNRFPKRTEKENNQGDLKKCCIFASHMVMVGLEWDWEINMRKQRNQSVQSFVIFNELI